MNDLFVSAKNPVILGIESSCDETAAAVVRNGCDIKSNVIASQHDLHAEYAGVVPEIASRAHVERILPVIRQAMHEAQVHYEELDAIAVGHRPGLIGSLLVGVSAAKALAWSIEKPLIGVDHVIAHLFAGRLDGHEINYPALGLVVSGGHTSLFHVNSPLDVQLLGKTIDDAVGEAFDKAATILQLGYPGGPKIDQLAERGNDRAHKLPVSALGPESLDFSFSGLKTALLYAVCGKPVGRGSQSRMPHDASVLTEQQKADFAASFQQAAIDALMSKVRRALDRVSSNTLLVGGGVCANNRLRRELIKLSEERDIEVVLPAMELCVDNAAMIASLGNDYLLAKRCSNWTLSASTQCSVR